MGNYHVLLKMLNDCEIVKWIGGDMIDIKEEIEFLKSNMSHKYDKFIIDPTKECDEERLASEPFLVITTQVIALYPVLLPHALCNGSLFSLI